MPAVSPRIFAAVSAPHPGDRDQRWRLDGVTVRAVSSVVSSFYLRSELTAAVGQDACQGCNRSLEAGDAGLDLVQSAYPVQCPGLGRR